MRYHYLLLYICSTDLATFDLPCKFELCIWSLEQDFTPASPLAFIITLQESAIWQQLQDVEQVL